MGATNQGYANLANTVLAIQRLNEVEKEGISRGELRRQQALATAEKTSLLQSKVREEQLQRGIEQQTGVGFTPETRALFAEPAQLLQPGAQTAEFLPQPTTTPGGFKIPGPQVLTTPSPRTIGEAFQRTGKEVRGETLASLEGVHGYGPETELYKRMQRQSKVPIPSSVEPTVKAHEDALGRRANIKKTGIETQGLESDVRVKEATEIPRIRTAELGAEKERQQVRSNELEYIYKQLDLPVEHQTKQLTAQLKAAELARQPDLARELKQKLEKGNLEIGKLRRDAAKDIAIQGAIEEANKHAPGTPERMNALNKVAALSGDATALLNLDVTKDNAYLNAGEKVIAANAAAHKAASEGDFATANALSSAGNDWAVRRARLSGNDYVTLTSFVPQPSWYGGTPGVERNNTAIKTRDAALYSQKLLQAAARGQQVRNPDYKPGVSPSTEEFIPPDYALFLKIGIEHGADKPIDYYEKIIAKEQAPIEAKQGALQFFQRGDPSIKAVTPTGGAFPGESTRQPGGGPVPPRTVGSTTPTPEQKERRANILKPFKGLGETTEEIGVMP